MTPTQDLSLSFEDVQAVHFQTGDFTHQKMDNGGFTV